MKLKFLSFNFLDSIDERVDLIKNYLGLALEIPNFDLWGKVETELISIRDLDERDAIKAKIVEALEKCGSILISRQKYTNQGTPRQVSEWIKNFVANLGLGKFDKLQKVEYLSNNPIIRTLDANDREKVKNLLDIYEKLRLSSKTPEGYENSVLMTVNGKTIIFNHGNVEEVSSGINKVKKIINEEKNSDALSEDFKSESANDAISPISTTLPTPPVSPLAELENLLKNYSENSLEHKAISQEISRLKIAEFKRAQKSDQK